MISAGREATMRRAISVLALLPLLVVGSSWAQDPLEVTPYYLVIDSTIESEDAGDWAAAATMTARAHGEHSQGNVFATYRLLTGGPDEKIRAFFPLEKMADLDGWISNRQILYETVGKDRGRLVLDDLELEQSSSERIVAYSAKLSSPPESVGASKILWVVEVEIEKGSMVEYSALALRVKKAYEQAGGQQTWLVYGNAIGGDRSQLTYLYGFDEFASLDDWPSRIEVLTAAYGDKEAARLSAALESLTRTRTSLWALESELSQLEGKQ
jgi:hypothetical protein